MDKKSLSEQDVRTKFITPAIIDAGWDILPNSVKRSILLRGRSMFEGS